MILTGRNNATVKEKVHSGQNQTIPPSSRRSSLKRSFDHLESKLSVMGRGLARLPSRGDIVVPTTENVPVAGS